MNQHFQETPENPPAFNIPGVVLTILAAVLVVHIARDYVISPHVDTRVLFGFAFTPIAYHIPPSELVFSYSPYWSPITHGFLHGDWTHLLVNAVWMVAFGSAVARRFGNVRFLIFMALSTAAGAGAHYIFHPLSHVPVIGASGAVSACMGAAVRFAFRPGGTSPEAIYAPALTLLDSLKNRTIMTFVIIWFVINWLFGSGIIPLAGDVNIAWEAHMGGFIFGWLGFALFDPKTPGSQPL